MNPIELRICELEARVYYLACVVDMLLSNYRDVSELMANTAIDREDLNKIVEGRKLFVERPRRTE